VELHDAYLSVAEALCHGAIANDASLEIKWVQSADVTEANVAEMLRDADGILVPGGFGDRGVEGKLLAIRYARENKIPLLGICLGMQLAVVEFARNVMGYKIANSTEFDPDTPYPVIDLMPDQKDVEGLGGTMRLGGYPCELVQGTKAYEAYGQELVHERHRHRHEYNNRYRDALAEKGLIISGVSPDGHLVEMVELKDHPWFVGCQFHPEFKSRPNRPHPLFSGLIKAALQYKR
jgi:CTP synthase